MKKVEKEPIVVTDEIAEKPKNPVPCMDPQALLCDERLEQTSPQIVEHPPVPAMRQKKSRKRDFHKFLSLDSMSNDDTEEDVDIPCFNNRLSKFSTNESPLKKLKIKEEDESDEGVVVDAFQIPVAKLFNLGSNKTDDIYLSDPFR